MIRIARSLLLLGFILGVSRLAAADSTNMNREILDSCVKVSAALAADDLAAAKTAATAVAMHAGMSDNKDIADKALAVAKADQIKTARARFKSLSAAVEPLAKNENGYVVMHCPMANADWIQTSNDVKNPYFGTSMLTCGAPKQAN